MNDPAHPLADRTAPVERRLFSNRTLNVRSLQAIGYDMDYTLLHYDVDEWERAAFLHARGVLTDQGWPVGDLEFRPEDFSLGLVFDLVHGNLVKATRFGYVVKAQHGTDDVPFEELRRTYMETVVDLGEDRFEFMNTLFELSRASLWVQTVALHDHQPLPGVRTYAELYRAIDEALGEIHTAGALKQEIINDPDRFLVVDPEIVETLQDQRRAGKKLLLITNSEWSYTRQMMAHAFDPFMPEDTTWRDLFDVVIVSAAKPRFFAENNPLFRIIDEDRSLLQPHTGPLEAGHVYFGGNARLVEQSLGYASASFLYVGDHLFGDVHVTKDVLRWRTALIVREIEAEVMAASAFAERQTELEALMARKIELDRRQATLRMDRQNKRGSAKQLDAVTAEALALDELISPIAREAANLGNPHWGPLMRAGNDKSLFARQVEKYADVYMSRVSNMLYETPYAYLRAARGSLPHDAVVPT